MASSKENFATSYLLFGFIRGLNFEIEYDIKQELKRNKLTFPKFRLLWVLYFFSNINMSELTYLAQTNISNVFRQLTKLDKEGLVLIESGDDSRIRQASLTKEGRKTVQDFIGNNLEHSQLKIVHAMEKIPKEDLLTFMEVCSFLSNELLGESFGVMLKKSFHELCESTKVP